MPTCGQCGTIEEDRAARYCRSCGTALSLSQVPPELQRIDLRGTVTVVRCDIVDSTPLVERHDPELVRRILTTYSDTARQTVARSGGMLERFVGDAVMAIFGFPMPREDDAVRAVRAAVELRERLGGFSERLQRDGIALGVRFAVDTGEIVAGRDDSGQLVFTGDVMNVVTRLEQAAPPGEILLGDATVGLLRELVEVEHVGPLHLKGKSGPVAAHRLLLLLPDASRQARDLEIPLVGRDLDCTILEKLHARTVQTRTSHLLTVFGAAGIGKSRLVEEFLRKVDGQPLVLRGRCLAYGGAAYDPIIQVIAQAADVDLADREQVRQRLAALVAGDEHASRIVERLEHMLELRSGTGPAEDTRWAVRRLLEILAAKHPLIVVLDDLHWAEPTLLGLVEDLAESLHTTPLLLVCLARTDLLDQRRRWAGGKVGATSMQLAPLGPDDVRSLVTSLLGDVPAAPEVQAYITELAGGNPLFVQSLVATLREARRLRLSDARDQWQAATDLAALPAPPDMQAVLQARIANLRPEEKRVIERAAVIGRQFSVDAVIDLSEGDERRGVRACLRALTRKELVVPARGALIPLGRDLTYSFPHSPVREAAYQGIPREVRAGLHERYAAWLQAEARQDLPKVDEFVGHHLERAHHDLEQVGGHEQRREGLARRAGAALAVAGQRAAARGDIPAVAVSLLERALRLLAGNDQVRRGALLGLADALAAAGDPARAVEVYDQVVAAAEQAEDLGTTTRARLGRLEVKWFNGLAGKATEAEDEMEHAFQVFDLADDDVGLAKAWRLRAHVHWAIGHLQPARDASDTAIKLARQAGDERLEAAGVSMHCSVLLAGPWSVEEVERYCNQALGWARTRGIASLEAAVLRVLAQTAAMQGRFEQARELLGRARAHLLRNGRGGVADEVPEAAAHPSDLLVWVDSLMTTGRVELLAGDAARAEWALRPGYRELSRLGGRRLLAGVAALLARALADQGANDEAEQMTLDCESLAGASQLDSQIRWRALRAVLLARRGEADQAERHARQAVTLASESQQTDSRAEALACLAEVLQRAGHPDQAGTAAEEAVKLYEQKGNSVSARRIRALHRL